VKRIEFDQTLKFSTGRLQGGNQAQVGTLTQLPASLTGVKLTKTLKSHGHPLSIEEIEMDAQFGIGAYKNLAERFFGPAVWSAGMGIATHGDMSGDLRRKLIII